MSNDMHPVFMEVSKYINHESIELTSIGFGGRAELFHTQWCSPLSSPAAEEPNL